MKGDLIKSQKMKWAAEATSQFIIITHLLPRILLFLVIYYLCSFPSYPRYPHGGITAAVGDKALAVGG